jgi:glycosyltransferase involved in cell wall biosynthesis
MISACIIVKNEEKNIKTCLDSIKDHVTEIIVNDTGSTDNTQNILKSYDCKVLQNKWEEDFSKARNQCLEVALQPYILIIDADEIILNPKKLFDLIYNSDEGVGGWFLNLTSKISGHNHKSKLLRFFKNKGFRFKGIIHEQIAKDIVSKGFKLSDSEVNIFHSGYDLTNDKHLEKQKRNLELLKKAIEYEGENSFYQYNLAKTYLTLNENNKAEKSIKKALELVKIQKVRSEYLKLYSRILFKLNKLQESYKAISQSIDIENKDIESNFIAAELLYNFKDYKNSLNRYKQVLDNYGKSNNYTNTIFEIL